MSQELEIYEAQGFAQSVGFGVAPAVVVVDFQVGFTDPRYFGGGNIGNAIVATQGLLRLARQRGWPVVHTRVVYADDGSDCGGFTKKVPALRGLTEGAAISQTVPALAPVAGELVLRKQNASAFFGTELVGWLAYRRVDTVLVSGCTTSGCVRATVIDSCSYGFRTIVVSDCVGDRALGPHEANLFDMKQKYADLMSFADIETLMAG